MGVERETALASSIILAFLVENINTHMVELHMPRYNRDYDRSLGFCCHNVLGLVGTVYLNGFRIGFPIRTCPRALSQQTPLEPVLIP